MTRFFLTRFFFTAVFLLTCVHCTNLAVSADEDEPGPMLYDKTFELPLAKFEDNVIEADNFVINNVMLNRQRNDYGDDKKMERLAFAASIKSKSTKSQEISVMMAGYDDKKTLLWTSKTTDSLYGKTVDSINDQIRVPTGTLKSTATIWLRVMVVTEGR